MRTLTLKCNFCGKEVVHRIADGEELPHTQHLTYLDACDDCAELAIELLRNHIQIKLEKKYLKEKRK